MMPGFGHGNTPEEIAAFCMRANRPEFAGEVRPGDLIVAGKNFGCGSSVSVKSHPSLAPGISMAS